MPKHLYWRYPYCCSRAFRPRSTLAPPPLDERCGHPKDFYLPPQPQNFEPQASSGFIMKDRFARLRPVAVVPCSSRLQLVGSCTRVHQCTAPVCTRVHQCAPGAPIFLKLALDMMSTTYSTSFAFITIQTRPEHSRIQSIRYDWTEGISQIPSRRMLCGSFNLPECQ